MKSNGISENGELPEAFLARMRAILGDNYAAFLAASDAPPVRGLRVNPAVGAGALTGLPLRAIPGIGGAYFLDTDERIEIRKAKEAEEAAAAAEEAKRKATEQKDGFGEEDGESDEGAPEGGDILDEDLVKDTEDDYSDDLPMIDDDEEPSFEDLAAIEEEGPSDEELAALEAEGN